MRAARITLQNIRRQPGHSLFAMVGIVIGIGMLIFFAALGMGVQERVVARIFPSNQVEVIPRAIQLGAFQRQGGLFGDESSGLGEDTIAALESFEGVEAVYPKQQIAFPALALGGEAILGETLYTEFLADGVPAELVAADFGAQAGANAFIDWESRTTCAADSDCAPGSICNEGSCQATRCIPDDEIWSFSTRTAALAAARAARRADSALRAQVREREGRFHLALVEGDEASAVDALRQHTGSFSGIIENEERGCEQAPAWCSPESRTCQMPVPALVSPTMLELYNSNVQSMMSGMSDASRLPRLDDDALIGLEFYARLGRGIAGVSRGVRAGAELREVKLRVVGFSEVAMPIGATLPLAYIQRWNAEYNSERAAEAFNSLLVVTEDAESLTRLVDFVRDELELEIHPRYEQAQRSAGLVSMVTLVLIFLSLSMVLLAAVNILHTFLMLVAERRAELGIMRCVGATRTQVLSMVLLEASLIGIAGSLLAGLLARSVAFAVDRLFTQLAPDFPFKPDSLFVFPWWLFVLGVAVALLFCVAGAAIPATRAARMDPADALRR